ncbi:ATP-binding protein [Maribellus sp. YY47]|uniref:sensor histidine kinase n=1 Tax=Maribellus sp. YY47 TaxID=2929486 RepID=UPI002001A762|nr:ATP-binding protein [Maribellus sp. YY47]MCK3683436.1 ATP-binding protein [Maribellus sp. YY47]
MIKKIRFEYILTAAYLLVGGLWIIFSDYLLNVVISNPETITRMQTYKGWFYVAVTGLFFFILLRKHLHKLRETETELQQHRDNLHEMVVEKTRKLDKIVEELSLKNSTIKQQNEDLKHVLENLNSMQSQLIQAEKMASIGVLTAGIAHEINNPLNYILGGLTGLENYFKEENIQLENTDFFLKSIRTGIERVNAIVSGLNKMSRNNTTLEENCDLNEIIGNCLMILSNELKYRIHVEEQYAEPPIIIQGNVGKLHQVFINILMNASQAIPKEGQIRIRTFNTGTAAVTEITDTGSGIDEVDLSKITEPFFTTKDPGKGTGLGLSITYNIIKEHKGEMHFSSLPGKGTTVTVELPIKITHYEKAQNFVR